MTDIALRRKNENFIIWKPVPASENVFTPLSREGLQVVGATATASLVATRGYKRESETEGARAQLEWPRYDAMLEMAKRFPPDESWYDEDFTSLRHPGR